MGMNTAYSITLIGPLKDMAFVDGDPPLIRDTQSALDLMATIRHETGSHRMILGKDSFVEEFFNLRSGLAGEILQKYVNYGMMLAIVGDFTLYESKALQDFIRESNRGRHVFFLQTLEMAIARFDATQAIGPYGTGNKSGV